MFVKIFAQIFDSSIAEDYVVRHVFMDLLILADKDGCVDMTPQAISRRTNVPLDIIQEALEKLSQPDPESRSQEQEGRCIVPMHPRRSWGWRIVNYQQYRNTTDDDTRREQNRERKQRQRERDGHAMSHDVTLGHADVTHVTDVTLSHASSRQAEADADASSEADAEAQADAEADARPAGRVASDRKASSGSSTGATQGRVLAFGGPPVHRSGSPTTKTPSTPSPSKPKASPASDAARRLAAAYQERLANPKRHAEAAEATWPPIFDRLLRDRSEQDLTTILAWAWEENEFWGSNLDRRKGDPVEYLAEYIERIAEDHERWKRGRERYGRQQAEQKAAEPKETKPKYDFGYDLMALFKKEEYE